MQQDYFTVDDDVLCYSTKFFEDGMRKTLQKPGLCVRGKVYWAHR